MAEIEKPHERSSSLKIAWRDAYAEAHGPIGIRAVLIIVISLAVLFATLQISQHYI